MPEENTTAQNQKKGGGKKKSVIISIVIGAIIVLVILIVALILLLRNTGEKEEVKRQVITQETVEQEIAAATEDVRDVPESYIVTQNSDWVFPTWDTPSANAYVENDANNETPVYFDLVLDSTGETIYSSPILMQGATFSGFALDKELPAGTYTCTLVYHLVDDEQNTLTTTSVGTSIQVQQ